jgi:hypothetical protein
MSGSVFSRRGGGEGDGRPPVAALHALGRVALWAVVAVLLLRGGADLLGSPSEETPSPTREGDGAGDPAVSAFAIRFARTYLEEPDPAALRPLLAAGAHIGTGRPPSAQGAQVAQVAQAEVLRTSDVGDGRVVVTVACELRDSRTLYLAVPVVRQGADEAAALGAPSIVAVPATAGADPERPRPVAGPDAGAIGELVDRFLPAYLSAGESSELSYYLAPDTQVVPLGGALESLGSPTVVQIGEGEGPGREVIAGQRVTEPGSGAGYRLAYRLRVVERAGRWYVAAVEGAVA